MTMHNGIYKVRYWTKEKVATGVVVLEDGVLQGGDSLTAFAGTYSADTCSADTGTMQASLRVRRHSEGMPTLFGEDAASLALTGTWTPGAAQLTGPITEKPDITIKLALERLDL